MWKDGGLILEEFVGVKILEIVLGKVGWNDLEGNGGCLLLSS